MSKFKTANFKREKTATKSAAKSTDTSQTKITKSGTAWKQKSVWFRKAHLNKLKVIAHFEDTTTDQLIDRALGEFIAQTFDKSIVSLPPLSGQVNKQWSASVFHGIDSFVQSQWD